MGDVTIFYQGGSGGFALYYYLLLSGNYQFDVDTVKGMVKKQFPTTLASTPKQWKTTEIWPDNRQLKMTSGPKLFLICNPLFAPNMLMSNQEISKGTYKILLYTDIRLQLRMAYEKQAYWFTEVSQKHFNAPSNTRQYLKQIINGQNNQFDPELENIRRLFSPDQEIRLEDLIKKKCVAGFNTPNNEQINFLEYWHSLQTPKSIKLLER